jgi:hypothetical protein
VSSRSDPRGIGRDESDSRTLTLHARRGAAPHLIAATSLNYQPHRRGCCTISRPSAIRRSSIAVELFGSTTSPLGGTPLRSSRNTLSLHDLAAARANVELSA